MRRLIDSLIHNENESIASAKTAEEKANEAEMLVKEYEEEIEKQQVQITSLRTKLLSPNARGDAMQDPTKRESHDDGAGSVISETSPTTTYQ